MFPLFATAAVVATPAVTLENVTALLTGVLGGGFFGGLLMKLMERHYQSKDKELDDGTLLRKELHMEVVELRNDLMKAREEIDAWREKYYDQVAKDAAGKVELVALRRLDNRIGTGSWESGI